MLQEAVQYGSFEDILREAGISQEEYNAEEEQEEPLFLFFYLRPARLMTPRGEHFSTLKCNTVLC